MQERIEYRKAFETIIHAFAKANNIPASFENVDFKSVSGAYLICKLFPAESSHGSVCYGSNIDVGFYQVTISSPLNLGANPTETIAKQISDLFPEGTKIGTIGYKIRITRPVVAEQAFQDKDRYLLPLSIYYSSI